MSHPRPLMRQPQSHHLHQRTQLLDHFFSLYLLSIFIDIITCVDILYYGIGCITWSYLILYFLRVIYTHHFLLYLSFFYFLYSLLFCFLNHVVSPIRLRLHVTQEVPLPPFIFNRSCHIEGNVDLGWGES